MKKSTLIIMILAIAGIIITTTAVLASSNEDQANPKEKFLDTIVDQEIISQEQADQIKEQSQDFRKERMQEIAQKRLDKAIEEKVITQEEAEEIKTWFESRPKALRKLERAKRFHRFKEFRIN